MMQNGKIEIVGADINNLKQLNVDFGLNQITMVVGRSGSGKSSLVEQIIAKEGNQRLENFLHVKDKAIEPREDLAFINRLPPTILFAQRAFHASKRTTIGTASGVLNILQKLFIRHSEPFSAKTEQVVGLPDVATFTQWLLNHAKGSVKVWAIPLDFEYQDGKEVAQNLARNGFETMTVRSETDSAKVYEQGKQVKTHNFKGFSSRCRRIIEVNVGYYDLKKGESGLSRLLELAFDLGNGKTLVEFQYKGEGQVEFLDSRKHRVVANDATLYMSPNQHNLTFNSPNHDLSGACQLCAGLGEVTAVVQDALFSNPELSMHQGACALWTAKNYKYINISHDTIEGLRGIAGFNPDIPWCDLPQGAKALIVDGAGALEVFDIDPNSKKKTSATRTFGGFTRAILARFAKQTKTAEKLAPFVEQKVCPECNGSRWAAHSRALKLGQWHLPQLLAFDFNQLKTHFGADGKLSQSLDPQGQALCQQFYQLCSTFVDVGLGHLTPDRQMTDISDGESRRLRLAAVLYAQLSGICMLLDEPTRGLHEKDIGAINRVLSRLKGLNTLIISDHRRKLATVADKVLALGPGAGVNGGQLLSAQQTQQNWWNTDPTDTGIDHHGQTAKAWLNIYHANYHHIQGADICLPLGQLVTIAGVSGSGKSSFVHGILLPVLKQMAFSKQKCITTENASQVQLEGSIELDYVVVLSHSAAITNKRSTIATFLDIAADIRHAYGKQAKRVGVKLAAADFSTNGGNGRCETCLGLGQLEDAFGWQTCSRCGGTQFKPDVLSVTCDEHNIDELLNIPISQLLVLNLDIIQPFKPLLQFIEQLGIGHLSLGRRSCDVSGGEIQRLKIARQLVTETPHHSVFILDEPAAGLHPVDVALLHQTLARLVAQGNNSVIIIEHNLALIAKADWVIEFGPGCGAQGGEVIAQGSVEKLLTLETPTAAAINAAKLQDSEVVAVQSLSAQEGLVTVNSAKDSLNKIKALVGYDILPSVNDGERISKPACIFDESVYAKYRLLEFGGLMEQVVLLALDARDSGFKQLLSAWQDEPEAELWINPLLSELAVWGENIPKTTLALYQKTIAFELGQPELLSAKDYRVKLPPGSPIATPQDKLNHGLNLGSGYVELRKSGKILASCANRLLDLSQSIVGPAKPLASSYLRHHANAQCPVCNGDGMVTQFDQSLLLGDLSAPIESNAFLAPNLLKIFKGVYRNELLPFFKRMIKEQLWPANQPVNKLSPEQWHILLYGYWCRPSHGSFLKSATANSDEVGAWLRWDGLVAHVRENLSRGDVKWQQQLNDSAKQVQCLSCKGTGLGSQGALLKLGERDIQDWLVVGTVGELYGAITKIKPALKRIERRQAQLLAILKPLMDQGFGELKLNTPLRDGPWQLIVESTLAHLSTLDLVSNK